MSLDPASLSYLATLLEQRTGQEIGPNRLWRVETVLKSLLKTHGLMDLKALVAALESGRNLPLADAVVEALLNNETFFFSRRGSVRSDPRASPRPATCVPRRHAPAQHLVRGVLDGAGSLFTGDDVRRRSRSLARLDG